MTTTKKPLKSASKKPAKAKPAKKAPAKAPVKAKPAKKAPAKKAAKKAPAKKAPAKKAAKKAPAKKTKASAAESTHITVVLDCSGSMSRIARAMTEGLASYLDDQKKVPGRCTVTAVVFESDVTVVLEQKPIAECPPIVCCPGGSTALYDGIMRGIDIAKTVKADKQLFVIITDGEENASRQFPNVDTVMTAIKAQKDWAFVFLGANQDSIATAARLGVSTANAVAFSADAGSVGALSKGLSKVSTGYRSNLVSSMDMYASTPTDVRTKSATK